MQKLFQNFGDLMHKKGITKDNDDGQLSLVCCLLKTNKV